MSTVYNNTSPMFLKVEGVKGETEVPDYEGWITISSFGHWVEQSSSTNTNGGCTAGTAQIGPLHITAPIDKSTIALMKFCASGKTVDKITVAATKAGGAKTEYYNYSMEKAVITEARCVGNADDSKIMVHYTFASKKIKNEYCEQNADGTRGPTTDFCWDIEKHREA